MNTNITGDDIDTLRNQGLSDDDILQGVGEYDPERAGDITTLLKQGLTPSQIVDGLQEHYDKKSIVDRAADYGRAIGYGASEELKRGSATAKAIGFEGTGDTLQSGADAIDRLTGPYEPASNHIAFTPRGLTYLPRAVVESLPATLGYGAAATGAATVLPEAAPGALIGAGVYGLSRYLGTTANERAANNGRSAPATEDVIESLPSAAVQGGLDAIGNRYLMKGGVLNPSPIKGAGWSAAGESLTRVGKAGVLDTATGGASDAVGQLGASVGTNKGARLDTDEALKAAKVAGMTSAALRAARAIPEVNQSRALRFGEPDAKQQVANDLVSDRISGDPNSDADAARMLKTAAQLYRSDIGDETSNVKARIRDLDSQGLPSKHLQSALDTASDLTTNLRNGVLDDGQVSQARATLAPTPELLNHILKLNELNRLAARQGTSVAPEGMLQGIDRIHSILQALKAASKAGVSGGTSGALIGSALGTPGLGAAVGAAARAALPVAGWAWRKAGSPTPSGSGSPVKTFTERFSGMQKASPSASTPGVSSVTQSAPPAPQAPVQPAGMPPPYLVSPQPLQGLPGPMQSPQLASL